MWAPAVQRPPPLQPGGFAKRRSDVIVRAVFSVRPSSLTTGEARLRPGRAHAVPLSGCQSFGRRKLDASSARCGPSRQRAQAQAGAEPVRARPAVLPYVGMAVCLS